MDLSWRAWLLGFVVVAVLSPLGCGRSSPQMLDPVQTVTSGQPIATGRGGSEGSTIDPRDGAGNTAGMSVAGIGGGAGAGPAGRGGAAGQVATRVQGGLFSVCLANWECEPGLFCACGSICTVRCSAAYDPCADLTPSAMCPDLIPLTGDCDPIHPGCVLRCGSDDDCRSLGPTAACLDDGWCKIPQPSTIVDGGAPSCDERKAPLREQVQAAVAAADRSCRVDGDCVNVSASNRCYGNACPLTYVSKAGGAELTMLLEALDAQFCDGLLRSGCVLPEGIHGCPGYRSPVCTNGLCVQKPPPGWTPPDAATD